MKVNGFLMIVFLCMGILSASGGYFAGGQGTSEDPFHVKTAEQLDYIRNHLDAHFLQKADIDLSSFTDNGGWIPIGEIHIDLDNDEIIVIAPFTGSYDGNSHQIKNLFINRNENGQALFSCISEAQLHNITLESVHVSGNDGTSGLVGVCEKSQITNCAVTGTVSGARGVGGLTGASLIKSTISHSHTACEVSGELAAGGLTGVHEMDCLITHCSSTGNITGKMAIGGLVGINEEEATIIHSYSTTEVTGNTGVGGLVGLNKEKGTVNNSYAKGNISGHKGIGGLCGVNENKGIIRNSYATGNISGNIAVGGLVGRNISLVETSYATGKVNGNDIAAGGLIGVNEEGGMIENTYATAETTGNEFVGGLVGINEEATISRSYAVGKVTGIEGGGGLVSINHNAHINGSFWNSDVNQIGVQHGDIGNAVGKTTAEMKREQTFLNAQWDLNNTWQMSAQESHFEGYPVFLWQKGVNNYDAVIKSFEIPPLYQNQPGKMHITIRNNGIMPWASGEMIRLGAPGNHDPLTPPQNWRIDLEQTVEPDQLHTFIINVHPEEIGVFITEWQMLKEGEFWFGEKAQKEVEVTVRTVIDSSYWQLLY